MTGALLSPESMGQAYELLRPEHMITNQAAAPVAYVPVGPLEYHGPHLPFGVDLLTADALCRRSARVTGGVVLPPVYVAAGALPLPNSITFPLETVRLVIRQLLAQLADGGFKVIVVFSGHGALDHLHVLRQECDRLMTRRPEIRARTTMWNELTVDVDGDIHDHGAKVETSYMMELWGDTVDLELLSDDPGAEHVGVYAANPRFTASRDWGALLSNRVVEALRTRVEDMIAGGPADNWTDIRNLVGRLQAGDLTVLGGSGSFDDDGLAFELENPHPQSKYITRIESMHLDGDPVETDDILLRNRSVGEGHTDRVAGELSPLAGFYIRRRQRMELVVPGRRLAPGPHELELELELAGVMSIRAAGTIDVAG